MTIALAAAVMGNSLPQTPLTGETLMLQDDDLAMTVRGLARTRAYGQPQGEESSAASV